MKHIIFTILMIVLSNGFVFAQTEPIDTDGNGFKNISTLDELRWVSENDSSWTWNFELDNDINAADTKHWNNGEGWSPIGNNSGFFQGIFDGNGFEIDSIYINRPNQIYVGFFGSIVRAEIHKVGVVNCNITGNEQVGGLVGENHNSIVINSYSSGNISGTEQVGGLVGFIKSYSSIIICYSSCNVSGVNYVGGFVGCNSYSTLSNSYSTGSVSGKEEVGGLVGDTYRSTVINSYSTSSISGTQHVGGLVGSNTDFSNIINSYSTGSVSGTEQVGGLVGFNQESNVKGSFWDTQTSGIDSSAGGKGKTTNEMKMKSTFTDAVWNFDFIWDMSTSYPVIDIDTNYRPSDTDSDGFLNISTLIDLRWLSESGFDLDSNIELDNDINAADTKNWNGTLGFSPIGYPTSFSGELEGNDFEIDSLYINRPSQSYVGFFGYIREAAIRNFGMVNCDIKGDVNVGGLVGGNYSSIVSNSYNSGSVSGTEKVGSLVGLNYSSTVINSYSIGSVSGDNYVGGLVGDNSGSKVINSYSTSRVEGANQVGCLVGGNYSSTVINSYSKGSVSGIEQVGGLVGGNYSQSTVNNSYSTGSVEGVNNVGNLVGYNEFSTVSNSYSTGSVSGTDEVGGLVGDTYRSTVINSYSTSSISGTQHVGGLVGSNTDFSNIINSYSTGSVSGTEQVGGLVGFNQESNVKGSFWDTQTSGIDSSAGGKGKTTNEMKMKSTFTDAVWNFDLIWDMSTSYPVIDIDTNYRPSDTDADGYLNISTLTDLRWLSESGYDLDSDWELDNDIDASDTKNWNNNLGFSPIGINYVTNFSGEFEGHGYKIYSLFINRPSENIIGLFGYIDDAEIRNVGIVNCNITGYGGVGALVGANSTYSKVSNSYSTGSVSGIAYVGGLVAYNNISKLINCYSRCSVEGDSCVGGLVGDHYLSSSIITCYSTGSVSGNEQVGGLVGVYFSSGMINSFWDIQTSGQTTSDGGTGKSTAEMKTKSTYTDVGWDFENIWAIDSDTNDGYPYFRDIPTSILENETIPEKNILVYPNPAEDYVEISVNNPSEGLEPSEGSEIEIYDLLGEKVFYSTPSLLSNATPQEGNFKINVSNLPKGVYFVKIGNMTKKFVKM